MGLPCQRPSPMEPPKSKNWMTSSGSCKFCTDVVDALETLIEDFGPDEQKIKEFAEGLCGHLIGKWVQEGCTKLVDIIVGYIDDNNAPETICSALPIAFCP